MTFPIKQIAINQFKNLTEQQDHLFLSQLSNRCITSFTTPESTPKRTTTQASTQDTVQASSASQDATQIVQDTVQTAQQPSRQISLDVTEDHVLPDGARRNRKKSRKAAYFTALSEVQDLSGYYSAFTAALEGAKRPHRDTLPPEPRSWRQMLVHPFAHQFKQAAQVEMDELTRRQT